MTEFICRRLTEAREIPWRSEIRADVLLHLKSREGTMPPNRAAIIRAMEDFIPAAVAMIPGIRIVGDTPTPSAGQPCATVDEGYLLDSVSAEEIRQIQADVEGTAAAAGANMIVTSHQVCHREWGKLGSERLPIRHFISLLAEALGVGEPDRYHAWWQANDLDTVVEQARPAWVTWDIPEAEAKEIAKRLFTHE